jgi:putative serine protease PepD
MRSNLTGSHVLQGTRSRRVAYAGPRSAAAGRWLVGAGAGVTVLAAAACSSTGGTGTASPSPAAASTGAASSLEQQYEQVVARVLPSVVQISTSSGSGSGSGVVYDAKGDIVTNAHVVGTATTLQVSPASGGKPLAAEVTGVFAPDDLAVIRVQNGAGGYTPRRSAGPPRCGSVRSCWPWATRSA